MTETYTRLEDVPLLRLNFPRPVFALHQIELTSRCSLRCEYCPSKRIAAGEFPNRPAADMTEAHFRRALTHVRYFMQGGAQQVLNVAGLGESMMLPHFIHFMKIAREELGYSIGILLATNGLHLTEGAARCMNELQIGCWVSLHRPEKAGLAVQLAKKYGIFLGISVDAVANPDDWAGQVSWTRAYPGALSCSWLRKGAAMVLADGRVTTCCLDAQGTGVIGHVDDTVGSFYVKPYSLCRTCQQAIHVSGWSQQEGKSNEHA